MKIYLKNTYRNIYEYIHGVHEYAHVYHGQSFDCIAGSPTAFQRNNKEFFIKETTLYEATPFWKTFWKKPHKSEWNEWKPTGSSTSSPFCPTNGSFVEKSCDIISEKNTARTKKMYGNGIPNYKPQYFIRFPLLLSIYILMSSFENLKPNRRSQLPLWSSGMPRLLCQFV